MATVYLHIGAPKTATSTLQNVLSANYANLLKGGVLYPRRVRNGVAHHTLACDLIEKYQKKPMPDAWYGTQRRGQAWPALMEELETHRKQADKVIISSELFFGQTNNLQAILDNMCEKLAGHVVKIVVYLRRQDQLYSSFYNQDIKGMRQWSESAYEFYETHQMLKSDYCDVLARWSRAFGKEHIIIRPFEPLQWIAGDIVQDFCHATGIQSLASNDEDQNESLGTTQLYVKRCLNRIGYAKHLNDGVLRVLMELCPEEAANGCIYVNKGLYRKYRNAWLQTNQNLAAEYLDNSALFKQDIPKPQDVVLYEINKRQLASYLKNMVNTFGKKKYRDYRSLFARASLLIVAEQDMWQLLDAKGRLDLLAWA